jgi:hypothetical protein
MKQATFTELRIQAKQYFRFSRITTCAAQWKTHRRRRSGSARPANARRNRWRWMAFPSAARFWKNAKPVSEEVPEAHFF